MQNEPKEKAASVSVSKSLVIALVCAIIAFVLCVGGTAGVIGYKVAQKADVPAGGNTVTVRTVADASPVSESDADLVEVIAAVANTVVEITTESVTTGSSMQQYVTTGAGSGVIMGENAVSGETVIITNNHVIEGATSVKVTLRSGESYVAEVIAADERTDVAVVKIKETGLEAAVLGNSDNLRVGESAIAIGNPLGSLGGTVTNGIISALDREIYVDGNKMTLLQTNAAINPGNSGGGLFNMRGELVGIVNAKSSGEDIEGLGFAIPVNTAKEVAKQLIELGYVPGRTSAGITVQYGRLAQSMTYGLYVTEVKYSESPFVLYDRIVSVGGKVMEGSSAATTFNETIDTLEIGSTVEVIVVRDGKTETLSVTVLEENNF